jgi:regulator of sigma E protease
MELLAPLFSNIWAIFLIVLFFGGSIFVHELGHFLAARRRGLHVERFSIGFGPKIFAWRGKDGVEYRLSWLPLGGYVALPQLADMRGIEGESSVDVRALPPISYATKIIVFAAGAFFNLIFAFLLATIIWFVGQPTSSDMATTRIGYVVPTLELEDGTSVTSPAVEAGLRIGDTVKAIDGRVLADWQDLMQTLVTGAGRTDDGRRQTVFTIERDGQVQDVVVHPRLGGDEQVRRVGIAPAYELVVHAVTDGSDAAKAGLQPQDRILALDSTTILNVQTYAEYLEANAARAIAVRVQRGDSTVTLALPPRPEAKEPAEIGLALATESQLVYPSPFKQFASHVSMTFRTLGSLIHPYSDVGIDKLSGPVGIIRIFHMAAQADIRLVLWFTILVNINLAIFNLLPIPVLDGGHMLFATIAKLRGRALPTNFILTTQSLFMVLLFSMMIYVTVFGDIRRIVRDVAPARTEQTEETETPAR